MAHAILLALALVAAIAAQSHWPARAQHMDWPWLGVVIADVGSTDPEGAGGNVGGGTYVTGVDQDGPSSVAGLLRHDIIVAVDGRPAGNTRELNCLIQPRRPGEVVMVTIMRGGRPRTFSVTLGRWPQSEHFPRPNFVECGRDRLSRAISPEPRSSA